MRIANIADIPEQPFKSPTGKFGTFDKPMTDAVGGDPQSHDLMKRWPFAVELTRLPAGAANYPYHSHATQWEFYIVVSGVIAVRHKDGTTEAKPGDFFMFGPGEPHQLINQTSEDATYYSVADNPLHDHCHYPDSDKWLVGTQGARLLLKGDRVDYFAGEDEAK